MKTLIKGGRVSDASGAVLWDPSAKAAPATLAVRLPAPAPAHNVAQDLDLVIAYEDEHLQEMAKLGVLFGSALAILWGVVVMRFLRLRHRPQ